MMLKSIFIAIVLAALSTIAFAQSNPRQYPASSKGTWLKVDTGLPASMGGPDSAGSPAVVLLSSLKIKPGMFLALRMRGAFHAGTSAGDNINNMIAVFAKGRAIVPPSTVAPPPAVRTLSTCPRGIPTDVTGDFNVPANDWIVVQVPRGADRLFFGPNDCFWRDNSDPNGDYAIQIVTLRDAIRNNVSWAATNSLAGTYQPPYGLTLRQVAMLGGYEQLNWVQVIYDMPTSQGRLSQRLCVNDFDCKSFSDSNGRLPLPQNSSGQIFIVDPIAGGYQYMVDAFGVRFPVRDDQPWYLDNRFGPLGQRSGLTQWDAATSNNILRFYDNPTLPLGVTMKLVVGLAGAKSGSRTGEIILVRKSTVAWDFPARLGGDVPVRDLRSIDSRLKNSLARAGVKVLDLE